MVDHRLCYSCRHSNANQCVLVEVSSRGEACSPHQHHISMHMLQL